MGPASVEFDSTLPLHLTVSDDTGGVEGLSPTVAVRNAATPGSYLDWDDNTFKLSGWGMKYATMVNIERGHYQKWLSLPAIGVSPGDFLVAEYHAVSGSVVGDAHDEFLIVRTATDLTAIRIVQEFLWKLHNNRLETTSGNPGTLVLYDDDNTTPIKIWSLRDETGKAILPAVGAPARRAKSVL